MAELTGYSTSHVLRWTARISSAISLLTILGFIVGEGVHLTRNEIAGFLFFPTGISVGMVLGWWKERIGGAVTVTSLLIFYCLHFASSGKIPHGAAWIIFALPGFLFVLAGDRCRRPKRS